MKIKIISMYLKHFKGIREAEYKFNDITDIFSKNGKGKTTIADAFYWLFTNKNYDIVSNPYIAPIGMEEIDSTVEVMMEVDGVEYVCRKTQKQKHKTVDGITKSKTTNHYEINGVERSETQYKNYLTELGIDLSSFLLLSNPNAFILEKPKDMRAFLMNMCNKFTDRDIALKQVEIGELTEMLENYTLDEVEAMQKSTIRKINENIGKNGELIDAQIKGIEEAREDVNVMGLEDRKRELEEELESVNKQQQELLTNNAGKTATQKTLQELKDEFVNIRLNIKKENNRAFNETKNKFDVANQKVGRFQKEIENINEKVSTINDYIEKFEKDKEEANSLTFGNGNCPTCNQPLPEDQLEIAKKKFEEDKNNRIKYAENKISQNEDEKKRYLEILSDVKEQLEVTSKELEEAKVELERLRKTLITDVKDIDYTKYEDLVSIVAEIDEKQKNMGNIETSSDGIQLAERKQKATEELEEVNQKFAKYQNNKKIDERIEEYKQEKIEKMQVKANAEKILHQVDVLKKAKNEIVVDEINSNFEIVKWKLFDTLKNGEYTEVCIPTIDGKDYSQEANNGLQMRARLDIVKGLQNYFDMHLPVFIDNAEMLDLENKNLINLKTQTIFLTVSEDLDLRFDNKTFE